MKYFDDQEVYIGDMASMGTRNGLVVCLLDSKVGAVGFDVSEWDFLNDGLLIEFEDIGLVHINDLDNDIRLVSRKL